MLLKSVTKEVKKLFLSKRSSASVQRQEEILHLKRRLEFDIQFSNLACQSSSVETRTLMEISKTVNIMDSKDPFINYIRFDTKSIFCAT
jgi:hypothetical protein